MISGAKLSIVTNDIVYKLRMQILTKLLKASYEDVEKIEDGKILAALNNDTEMLSTFANVIIRGATDFLTLVTCCIYLSIINVYALLFSLLVIIIIASIYYLAGRSANKVFEGVRDIQNRFFKFINALVGGHKELNINEKKREEFLFDVEKTCDEYRKKRYEATLKFLNVNVGGELLFTLAIASVVFVMPLIVKGIQSSNLRSYVFILLYLTGPVNGILRAIPTLLQIRISWNRINQLIKIVSAYENNRNQSLDLSQLKDISMKLNNIEYEYTTQDNSHFKIGPINFEFNTGEIIFITGGNGSGKSTLAKIMTGLYTQSRGHILVNEQKITPNDLGQYFSTIFSDFYIFEKLYGIDHEKKSEDIEKYLNILQISDKLTIENGVFSTTKLSSGQRKRLALLISYLEDKPFCLFDEWAADQDPEFRKFFYMELLPELKNRGKCVIAITHDDSYFHTADKIIKMEYGKIIHEALLSDRLESAVSAEGK
jgi:cyclic peptide transporter